MADDDEVEVKVFHSQDTEEQDAQDQLTEDKKDVVLEAEMEVTPRPEDIGVKPGGAFSKPMPSPSFGFPGMFPMMMAPYSPSYNLMLANMMTRNPLSPAYMIPNMVPNSPTLVAAAACMMAPGSPVYDAIMAASNPLGVNMRPPHMNPLSQMNQMRLSYANSPITTLANGMPDNHRRRGEGGKMKKEDHIKKPLNAFMWFMKENRTKVQQENGFVEKQSAELNKELGRRWQELPKEEQAKYFEMAKKDREAHKEKFPNWSARENYAVHKKKKKRRDRTDETTETKKCRARFGTQNQDRWCKFCKRKKKCEWATAVEPTTTDNQEVAFHPATGYSVSASESSGPSPLASSSSMGGPSPLGASHHDSDTDEIDDLEEMDAEEDDEDTTLTHQALQDIVKPEFASF